MELKRLDTTKICYGEISKIIYNSNKDILKYVFGKKQKTAEKKLKKLITTGKNHYGCENIYLAIDKETITGLFICFSGKDQKQRMDYTNYIYFLKLMHIYGILRYKLFIRPLFEKISLISVGFNDLYMSDIILNNKYNINSVKNYFLLEAVELSKSKKCERIIMEISINKNKDKSFYENFGFKEIDKKYQKIKSEFIGNYILEYIP